MKTIFVHHFKISLLGEQVNILWLLKMGSHACKERLTINRRSGVI